MKESCNTIAKAKNTCAFLSPRRISDLRRKSAKFTARQMRAPPRFCALLLSPAAFAPAHRITLPGAAAQIGFEVTGVFFRRIGQNSMHYKITIKPG
jgi:hypothetical protein